MDHNRLQVYARIRPALPREVSKDGFTRCLGVPKANKNTIILTTTDQPILLNESGGSGNNSNNDDGLLRYQLDGVIEESSSNSQVFETVCWPLIDGILNGINGCLFSYGQTGSGKTHTMLGCGKNIGLILLVAQQLLEHVTKNKARLSMSYVQIYGKEITDLLDDDNETSISNSSKQLTKKKKLVIRDSGEEVYVEGLSRWNIETVKHLDVLLKRGSEKRIVANTKLNATSSRSHALITFYYESSLNNSGAKLHMVDLAGSERVKESGVSGKTLKEV